MKKKDNVEFFYIKIYWKNKNADVFRFSNHSLREKCYKKNNRRTNSNVFKTERWDK